MQLRAYPPNDFGLYGMAGNVAEWVADVYRPIIDEEMNDFNYYRGNLLLIKYWRKWESINLGQKMQIRNLPVIKK